MNDSLTELTVTIRLQWKKQWIQQFIWKLRHYLKILRWFQAFKAPSKIYHLRCLDCWGADWGRLSNDFTAWNYDRKVPGFAFLLYIQFVLPLYVTKHLCFILLQIKNAKKIKICYAAKNEIRRKTMTIESHNTTDLHGKISLSEKSIARFVRWRRHHK